MHQSLSFGGPVIWFLLFLFALAFVGALYQLVDLARRGDDRYGRWGRLPWMPLPLLFTFGTIAAVIGFAIRFRPVLTAGYGLFLIILTVANLVQLPAYLLRVVFPTAKHTAQLAELHPVAAAPADCSTGGEHQPADLGDRQQHDQPVPSPETHQHGSSSDA